MNRFQCQQCGAARFVPAEKAYGHIIDPRTGFPAENALLSAVALPGAAESDALSTALLTAPELMESFSARRPEIRCLVARARKPSQRSRLTA